VGGEWNLVRKDPARMRFRIALCYPDVYEIGMSHLGLSVLYHLVNDREDRYAERCFAPWPDLAHHLEKEGLPLFTLETGTPLTAFDVVGFSLQHELLYTNVLYMLRLAGLPLRSEEREASAPLLVAGGSGAYTPEVLAPAFDLFLLGDGEAVLPPVIDLLQRLKEEDASRAEKVHEAAKAFPFVYAPSLCQPRYSSSGRYLGLEPEGVRIRPGLVEDLDAVPVPARPVQPGIRCVHDRITLEIMRGCTRGCRFCQAGMIKRPLRTRKPETLLHAARAIYAATGYDEISLCSLSSADYPELESMLDLFNEAFEPLKVGLSLPSLRVRKNLKEVHGLTTAVRKAGFTLAPEAATEAMRLRMNKPITDQDLEEAVLRAYELGWRRVKLYFMIGLPGEEEDDVRAIAALAGHLSQLRRRVHKGPAQVTVSVSTFVPKAHTPFQWCAMAPPDEIRRKHRLLLDARLPRAVRLKFHSPGMSFVEGMLARGDRRMFDAVEEAHRRGACFDAWKEHFLFTRWESAFEKASIHAGEILFSERGREAPLPWAHIDPGPSRDFLWRELEKAGQGETTSYCEEEECHRCGVDIQWCSALKKRRSNNKANQ
jgi:radical SAM family uncharacterized protein